MGWKGLNIFSTRSKTLRSWYIYMIILPCTVDSNGANEKIPTNCKRQEVIMAI